MAHTITLTQDQLSAIINNAIANALNAQTPAQPAPQPKAEKQYTGKEPATAKQLWALFKCEKHAAKAAGKSFATWQEWKLANSKLTYSKAQKRFEKLGLPKPE